MSGKRKHRACAGSACSVWLRDVPHTRAQAGAATLAFDA